MYLGTTLTSKNEFHDEIRRKLNSDTAVSLFSLETIKILSTFQNT
jgi:hypothetical protein